MIADYIRTPDGKILFTNVKESVTVPKALDLKNKNTN
jgi:hypothetical protein